ncbi:hypothetical protein LOAG_07885 [Loa loa]|uniref:Uncharacterized protein n=1 Tax=Loa loa TaxID=7209 RepID=A0A1S0TVL3_LOALO|nr:hypothetical protein LOAG_07885 [Loa loa]EFO20606.2 hypothetical protein LOAG_07885 [Loa loa]
MTGEQCAIEVVARSITGTIRIRPLFVNIGGVYRLNVNLRLCYVVYPAAALSEIYRGVSMNDARTFHLQFS